MQTSSEGGVPSSEGAESIAATGSAAGETAGGASVGPPCNRYVQELPVDSDTWVNSGKPNSRHGSDAQLSVMSSEEEHRVLVTVTLPSPPSGATLRRALLVLNLESAGSATAERRLVLYGLTQHFDERWASWRNYAQQSPWVQPGGDLGLELSRSRIPAMTGTGSVDFELTDAAMAVADVFPRILSLLVLEPANQQPNLSALAFTSLEAADTLNAPRLRVVYCLP